MESIRKIRVGIPLKIRPRLGGGTVIEIEHVEKFGLTVTGKHRFIVSEVDIDRLTSMELEVPSDKAAFLQS